MGRSVQSMMMSKFRSLASAVEGWMASSRGMTRTFGLSLLILISGRITRSERNRARMHC